MTGQLYHLSCPNYNRTWWDVNPFPDICPWCGMNRKEIFESNEVKVAIDLAFAKEEEE